MKRLRPDDPRVTSYALGELSPKEANIVGESLCSDPALVDEMSKTQALGRLLCEAYERQGLSLHPVQREVIRRVGRDLGLVAIRSARRRNEWIRGVTISLGAAAAVAFALFIMSRTPVSKQTIVLHEPEQLRMEVVLSPTAITNWGSSSAASTIKVPTAESLDVPEDKNESARKEFTERILKNPQHFFASAELTVRRNSLPTADSFVPLQENDYLSSSEAPSSIVPVLAGRTSFAWVERYLREQGTLPPKDAVRLEELVNYPDYEEESAHTIGGIRLSTQLVPCPWNPDSLLLGILLQRQHDSEKKEEVAVRLDVTQGRIASYRLLGFARPDGEVVTGADASHPLAAGNSTYVFYEMIASDVPFDQTPLGQVAMSVTTGGQEINESIPIPSIPGRWLDSTNSFRTAATVAAYALVLRDSPHKGTLDFIRVESLARQTLLDMPQANPAVRDVLELIIETRALAGLIPRA